MKLRTEIAIVIIVVVIAAVALLAYINFGSGVLEVRLTDPPEGWGEATQVYLNYSSVEIHQAQNDNESGWFTVIDQSAWINLTRTLDLNQTIGRKNLQTGKYNLIRFRILEAFVTVGPKNYTATVPSGQLQIAVTRGGIESDVQINTGQTSTLLIELSIEVRASTSGYRIVPDVQAMPL